MNMKHVLMALAFIVASGLQAATTNTFPLTGNVGVGTTTPAAALDVTNGYLRALDGSNTAPASGKGIELVTTGSQGYIQGYDRTGSAFLPLNFYASVFNFGIGNVGIGTSSPQRLLDLSTSGKLGFGDNVGVDGSQGIYWHSGSDYGLYKTAGSWASPNYQQLKLSFLTGIVIDGGSAYGKSGTILQPSGGYVGIGTTSPTTALTVNGTTTSTAFSGDGSALTSLNGSNISSGTVAAARLGSGSSITTKFLRGDSTWQTSAFTFDVHGNIYSPNTAFSSTLTTGANNFAIGAGSLGYNTTGYINFAFGDQSLNYNTTGFMNVAMGLDCLYSNTTGFENIAMGSASLYSNTTGCLNVAIGGALDSNTAGFENVAIGYGALAANTTGTNNSAFGGTNPLRNNTTGNFNAAFGEQALATNTTGSYNVAIGYQADVASGNLTNATAIGRNATAGASNTVILGGGGSYAVQAGINTSVPRADLDVVGTGAIVFPSGTNAERPATPVAGMMRFNTTATKMEYYNGTVWVQF